MIDRLLKTGSWVKWKRPYGRDWPGSYEDGKDLQAPEDILLWKSSVSLEEQEPYQNRVVTSFLFTIHLFIYLLNYPGNENRIKDIINR